MNRIDNCFKSLKEAGRTAFIPYVTASDPNPETSLSIMKTLIQSGADILEIGMPFSDPIAEGPIIQAAHQRAIQNGGTMNGTFDIIEQLRKSETETPIILMGYFNSIYQYGIPRFLSKISEIGIDGLIVVDCPPEHDEELFSPAKAKQIHMIRLITPTTSTERLKGIIAHTQGFLYYVSITGITGTESPDLKKVEKQIQKIRQHTELPIGVGFGIKTAEDINVISKFADATIIGSSIIKVIEQNHEKEEAELIKALMRYLDELKINS